MLSLNYDFKNLSDYEFELMIHDLLENDLSIRLESFSKGRDRGIDFRNFIFDKDKKTENIIIQCKHYSNSTFSNLLSIIKNDEVNKIKNLSPDEYILCTSLNLSVQQKQKLENIILNYCKNIIIYGCEDINALLRKYGDIEKKYYKLWLPSTNILERVLYSDIYNKNIIKIKQMSSRLIYYVENEVQSDVIKQLEDKHVCIITGNPGSGKSTLAEMIILDYIQNKDYTMVYIRNGINDAYSLLKADCKQIFYYDDFLGQTDFNINSQMHNNSDISCFIYYVKSNSDKRFIMTSRSYVLEKAINKDEDCERTNYKKYMISMKPFNLIDKFKIIYNYLYFEKTIDERYIDNILKNNIFDILCHKNFVPRIISQLCGNFIDDNADCFFERIMQSLDNPIMIWEKPFEKLSDYSKELLILLPLYKFWGIEIFEDRYMSYRESKSKRINASYSFDDYDKALLELKDSFIYSVDECLSIESSVEDFINHYLLTSYREIDFIIDNTNDFYCCIHIYEIIIHSENTYKKVYKKLIKKIIDTLFINLYEKTNNHGILLDVLGLSLPIEILVSRISCLINIADLYECEYIQNYFEHKFFYDMQKNIACTQEYSNEIYYLIITMRNDKYFSMLSSNLGNFVKIVLDNMLNRDVQLLDHIVIYVIKQRNMMYLIDEEIFSELKDGFNFYHIMQNMVEEYNDLDLFRGSIIKNDQFLYLAMKETMDIFEISDSYIFEVLESLISQSSKTKINPEIEKYLEWDFYIDKYNLTKNEKGEIISILENLAVNKKQNLSGN